MVSCYERCGSINCEIHYQANTVCELLLYKINYRNCQTYNINAKSKTRKIYSNPNQNKMIFYFNIHTTKDAKNS